MRIKKLSIDLMCLKDYDVTIEQRKRNEFTVQTHGPAS